MRLLLFFLLFSGNVFGQNPISFDYVNDLSADSIKSYLYVLTSDSLEGRESGKRGQKKAAEFISGKYKQWNIPAHLQRHSLSLRINSGKNLSINEQQFIYYNHFYYVGPQNDTSLIFNRLLVAGFGISSQIYNDFKDVSVANENILVRWTQPEWKKKSKEEKSGPQKAKSLFDFITGLKSQRPASILIVVDSIPALIHEVENDLILTSELKRSSIPIIFLSQNTAENFFPKKKKKSYAFYIEHLEKKGKPNQIIKQTEFALKIISDPKVMIGENVIALIEGESKKDEYIVVSAHYDHLGIKDSLIYHGADDNASGTSAVLEMARIFQKAKNEGNGPERSMIFLNVSGEEQGLYGSTYYVKHPFVPLSKTVADLNIDMIGRIDDKHDSLKIRDYIYLIGANRLSNELSEINKKANADFTKLELDTSYDTDSDPNRFYQRSDHYNFAKNNVPVIFYFNGSHADYHKPTDTPDKIDFPLIRKRAQLVFLTAWELVNRSERIKLNK